MATFRLAVKIISRKAGQSAVAAAAYRSGEALHSVRDGEVKDYTARAPDVIFSGIFAPQDAPAWARDREQLWNQVEAGEKRKDAQLAREFQIALPHELDGQQREWLLKDFIREQFTRQGYVVDAAIHAPGREGDARNYHAHLMVAPRTIDAAGFAPTKDRALNSTAQLAEWREEWAKLANRHLERHDIRDASGELVSIDHRSHAARGLDAEPTKYEGPAVTGLARQGIETERRQENSEIRARNSARHELAAYAALKAGELAADLAPAAPAPGQEGAELAPAAPPPAPAPGLDHPAARDAAAGQEPPTISAAQAAPYRVDFILVPEGRTLGGDAPPLAASHEQAEARQPRPAAPAGVSISKALEAGVDAALNVVEKVSDSLSGMFDAPTPPPRAAPPERPAAPPPGPSPQDIERDRYLAALDRTYAQNLQHREQDRDGGRELER